MKHLLEFNEFKIGNSSVCSLIINENNEILILKRGEDAPWKPNLWSLVGGKVNKGEDKKIASVREIKEETNLVIKIEDLVLFNETYDENEHYYLTCYKVNVFNTDVHLDSQNSDYEWINKDTYKNYEYVPHVKEYLEKHFTSYRMVA